MKPLLGIVFLIVITITSAGQSLPASEVLSNLLSAQQRLSTFSSHVHRTDTLVNDMVRHFSGQIRLTVQPQDTVLGFYAWSKTADQSPVVIYDGRNVFEIDEQKRKYSMGNTAMGDYSVLGKSSGRLLLKDLVQLDTSAMVSMEVSMKGADYILTIHRTNLDQYDISNRFNQVVIDPVSWLPKAIRTHQETGGKVQDLFYEFTEQHINEPSSAFNFSSAFIPAGFQLDQPQGQAAPPDTLSGKPAKDFALNSLDNEHVQLSALRGKVVLLDFWEVWCAPCVASMPEVDKLYRKYEKEGLQVYGVMRDSANITPAKRLIAKQGVSYHTLLSTDHVQRAYGVSGIPFCVLIDRKGMIRFIAYGFSPLLEGEIQKALRG